MVIYANDVEKQSTVVESESLVNLIFKKKWRQVLWTVSTDNSHAYSCDARCCNTCVSSHAPLQFACCCNPPAAVVKAMIAANPVALKRVDCTNRTPLHVACEFAASPQAIRLLLQADPSAAMRKDGLGRLPLHTLCENYYTRCDPSLSENEAELRLTETITDLIGAFPASLHAEDDEEMCPIEYAIEAELEHRIVYKMQTASIKLRKVSNCVH